MGRRQDGDGRCEARLTELGASPEAVGGCQCRVREADQLQGRSPSNEQGPRYGGGKAFVRYGGGRRAGAILGRRCPIDAGKNHEEER